MAVRHFWFLKYNFLTARVSNRPIFQHRAIFREDWSNRCWDIAIFFDFQDGSRHYIGFSKISSFGTGAGLILGLIHRFPLSLLFHNHRSLPVPIRGCHLQTWLSYTSSLPPLFSLPPFPLSSPTCTTATHDAIIIGPSVKLLRYRRRRRT